MSPNDPLLLLGESRAHPMHMGGPALFTPGATAAEVRELFETVLADDQVSTLSPHAARCAVTSFGQSGWDNGSPRRKWTGATTPVLAGGRCPGGHGEPLR